MKKKGKSDTLARRFVFRYVILQRTPSKTPLILKLTLHSKNIMHGYPPALRNGRLRNHMALK